MHQHALNKIAETVGVITVDKGIASFENGETLNIRALLSAIAKIDQQIEAEERPPTGDDYEKLFSLLVDSEVMPQKLFYGGYREEVASIMMQEFVDDYEDTETVPEWAWVEQNASYAHTRNGVDAWEFVLNLAIEFDDIPEKLLPVIQDARKQNLAYLIIHQGN